MTASNASSRGSAPYSTYPMGFAVLIVSKFWEKQGIVFALCWDACCKRDPATS